MEINWQQSIDAYFKAQQQPPKPFAENEFRASSLNGCVRQCTLNRLGLKQLDEKTLRHFGIGTLIHRFMQQDVALGHIRKRVEFEKQVEFELDGVKFTGHVDCFDGETVYDFKSSANAEVSAKYDNQGYIWQLNIYMAALGVTNGKLVYIDKRDLSVIEKNVSCMARLDTVVTFCKEVIAACAKYKETGELPKSDLCFMCKSEALEK